MSSPAEPPSSPGRNELRRNQVLDAAAECFRREGVHGSSTATICQVAISPARLYQYFSSKEAMVEAIAEREESDMAELVRRMEQDSGGGNLAARLTRRTQEMVERNSDPDSVGLMLELAAEAARNPTLAKILQRTDRAVKKRFLDMARRIGLPEGLDESTLVKRMNMIAALLSGLALRSYVELRRDRAAIVDMTNEHVRLLIGPAR
ncbi:TetR/AcrR family transcriptional regulator [Variovorax paradoxus]|uniref:TetR/AcrR family transcriptional regulator n=1 Tax=Variovorax paradoxus TaxID=34073 RepID=UPI0027837900|nr:TetR/AcrR family transcriptional regulator [Variovorax paradoxus]MDP9928166.1 AcrR family transcriptional regulator [Variovorax paradoxus]